jgi:MYXO-CTERM domain-containing protein
MSRVQRFFPYSLGVMALSLSLPIAAAEPPAQVDAARPSTWDMTVDELREIGLGQSRGDPVPVPPSAGGQPHYRAAATIFVNFDGAQLNSGSDNSKTNTTQIGELAGSFPAYGDGPKREAVLQAVRKDWADYNVTITDDRPASGDYVMNMTGPVSVGGGVLGVAPLDCDDRQPNNITYAFHGEGDSFSAAITATTISQEVAHSFGLEHVDEPGDIMNPYNAGGDASFRDECIQIVSNQGIACDDQHARECGSGDQQNAHAELLSFFGASAPDTAAPVVEITAPLDGAEFEVGADFEIEVEANDNRGIKYLDLYANGESADRLAAPPYGWPIVNIPEGTYEFHIEAVDEAGNEAVSNTVSIRVGTPAGDESGGAGPGGTTTGGASGTDSGDLDTDGDTDTEGADQDGDAGGCACRSVGGGAPSLAAIVLLGLAFVGRRRRFG